MLHLWGSRAQLQAVHSQGRGSRNAARARGRSTSFNRANIICRDCGGQGHFRDECPSAVFCERGFAMSEEVYKAQDV